MRASTLKAQASNTGLSETSNQNQRKDEGQGREMPRDTPKRKPWLQPAATLSYVGTIKAQSKPWQALGLVSDEKFKQAVGNDREYLVHVRKPGAARKFSTRRFAKRDQAAIACISLVEAGYLISSVELPSGGCIAGSTIEWATKAGLSTVRVELLG